MTHDGNVEVNMHNHICTYNYILWIYTQFLTFLCAVPGPGCDNLRTYILKVRQYYGLVLFFQQRTM
jgi:hypothetical protein